MAPRKKVANSSRGIRKSLRLNGPLSHNGPFLDLPLDVLLEILKLMHPLSLLYLSRTNKALRGFILDRENAAIWRASFEGAEGSPPKCPPYSCEPEWARLLFEEICHVCLSPLEHDYRFDPIWWEFSARYCDECSTDQVLSRLPNKLEGRHKLERHNSPWNSVFPRVQGFYLAKDVNEFMATYLALNNEDEKAKLAQERRDLTKAISDYARVCKPWMASIVEARLEALKVLKDTRWTVIEKKLHQAGWPNFLVSRSQWQYHDVMTVPQPLSDAEWVEIGPKFLADFETRARSQVLPNRFLALSQAFPNLSQLTKNLAIQPRIVDVALLPDVQAILDTDLKVDITKEELKTTLAPRLPELLAAWSSDLKEKLREHTSSYLKTMFPDIDTTGDPFKHALAYFICEGGCCQGYFTGQWPLCRDFSYWRSDLPETYAEHAANAYGQLPCKVNRRFSLSESRIALVVDVIKLYGKDPQNVTCEEMDAAPGKLWCMRCKMQNQPTGWRDAYSHTAKFHEKVSSLRPRWEVEIETE
ncbi:hypothetical protein B0H11DRAFT_2001060 [Mycena galericulata]|nr:hypothetical protein B0H11DRAFT_2001060 [Mycena galericulata]